jgi:hypothetical protein
MFAGKCSGGLLAAGKPYAAAGFAEKTGTGFPKRVGTQKVAKPVPA